MRLTYTLSQLHGMNEDEISNVLKDTIYVNSTKDLYFDQLDSGQFAISYAEEIQAIFDTFDVAFKYWKRVTS